MTDEADRRVQAALGGDVPAASGISVIRIAAGADLSELEGALPDQRASAQAMALLVIIVAFMAVAVVAGALETSVRRRAGQIAMLRAIGATPRQVRILCQAEAALISVLAAVIGGALGLALSGALLALFRSLRVVTPTSRLHASIAEPLSAAVVVLVIGQAAAWFAARSALKARPAEALTGSSAVAAGMSRRRNALKNGLGVVLLLGAGALQLAGMRGLVPDALRANYGMFASLLIMIGVAAISSPVIHLIATATRGPVARLSPTSGFLAASNVRFHHRRYAGFAAPLAVGVAIAGWGLSGLPLFARAYANLTLDGFRADHVVAAPLARGTYLGLTERDRLRLADVAGVEATLGIRRGWAQATQASRTDVVKSAVTWGTTVTGSPSRLLALGRVRGDVAKLDAGEGIALGEQYARSQGLDVGTETTVRVAGATRPVTTHVVALFDHEAAGDQVLVIPESVVADAAGRGWYEHILLAGDADDAALAGAVAGSGLDVQDPGAFRTSYIEQRAGAINSLGTIAVTLAGFFLVVASTNALSLAAADRRGELRSLQHLNATQAQVRGMVVWEMLLTVGPAWLLGMLATAWMAFAMAGGSLSATLWAYPWAGLSVMGAAGFALASGGSLLATRAVAGPASGAGPRS